MAKFSKRDIDRWDPINSRIPKLPGNRYKLDDVQEDLDDYLNELDDPDDRDMMRERPVPTIPDVCNMLDDLIRHEVGREGSVAMTPLIDIRIPTLRRVRRIVTRYGFDQLAAIIDEHIKIRQLPKAVGLRNAKAFLRAKARRRKVA